MRQICPLIVLTLVLGPIPAAGADSSLIVLGRSIGPVTLGMAENEVVRRLGEPRRVETIELAAGGSYRVASYRRHGGSFRVSYGGRRVVGVSTSARYYRTASGIGPGSPSARAAALPGAVFDQCLAGYVVGTGRTVTYFFADREQGPVQSVWVVRTRYVDC